MNAAPCGPNESPPIHTCWSRHRPAISGWTSPSRATCMARTASSSRRSARKSAATMAATLPTISVALRLSLLPSSASAIDFAPDVRFSIFEDDADSERSNTEANGATSAPNSASNRAISTDASSASVATSAGSASAWSAISGTRAARYGPVCRWRTRADTRSGEIFDCQARSSVPTAGHDPEIMPQSYAQKRTK